MVIVFPSLPPLAVKGFQVDSVPSLRPERPCDSFSLDRFASAADEPTPSYARDWFHGFESGGNDMTGSE